jgi:hypothetical protein
MTAAQLRYEPSETTPRRARRFVNAFLRHVGADHLRQEAGLLTTELVADALRQAPTQVAVRVELDHSILRVEVSDDPGLLPDAESGRFERRTGRKLVDGLASRWGSDLDRDRTTTWFELAAVSGRKAA